MSLSSNARGFAALPMLAAILLLSAGALMVLAAGNNDEGDTASDAQGRLLDEARSAIDGFAGAHARLPCPDLGIGGNFDGVEDCQGGSRAGRLPYATLGIADRGAGNIAYAPYAGLADANETVSFNLGENLTGSNFTASVAASECDGNPDCQAQTRDSAKDIERQQLLDLNEAFYAGMVFRDGGGYGQAKDPWGNTVYAQQTSYIHTFNEYLSLQYPDGMRVSWKFSNGEEVHTGETRFDWYNGADEWNRLKTFSDNLETYVRARRFKVALGDRPGETNNTVSTSPSVQDGMPGRLRRLTDDILYINSGTSADLAKVTVCASNKTLQCVYDTWVAERDAYNGWVHRYNTGIGDSPGGIGHRFLSTVADPLVSYDYHSTLNDPSGDIDTRLASSDPVVRTEALQSVINGLSSAVTAAMQVLNDTLVNTSNATFGKASGSSTSELETLISLYDQKQKDAYDVATWVTPKSKSDEYQKAGDLYYDLWWILDHLRWDILNSPAAKSFQDELAKLESQQGDVPSGDQPTAASVCANLVADYPSLNEADCIASYNQGTDAFSNWLQNNLSLTAANDALNPVTYPARNNLYDLCGELNALPTASTPVLVTTTASGSLPIAYALVAPGPNQARDIPWKQSWNVSSPSYDSPLAIPAPDRAPTLGYDDRMRVVTADELSGRLSCAALNRSQASHESTTAAAAELYRTIDAATTAAEQQFALAGVMQAMAVARVVVDAADIAISVATAIAETATCAASLGIAVNMCIGAGLAWSSVGVSIAALVSDISAMTQAAVALVNTRTTYYNLKDSRQPAIKELWGDVVSASIAADVCGGVKKLIKTTSSPPASAWACQ